MIHTEQMHCDPAYRERLRACGLDTVGAVLARVDGRVAAWSRTTDTLYVPGVDGAPGYYVKRHYFPRWKNRLRGTFRGTFFGMHRGHAEYLALTTMREVGIPAVRAVAYGGRRLGHFLTACFLITEEVPDAVNLTTFALQVRAGRRVLSVVQRRALLRALAEQLATMHAAGISHGNLFWRNILVRAAPDGQPEFFFLDAQPLRSWERLGSGRQWWQRELAQVAVSALTFTTRTEQLRFFRHYMNAEGLDATMQPQLAEIARLAQGWRRHEERRIRMNGLFEEWNRQLLLEEQWAALAGGAAEPAR
jgi:hypothetical protein